MNSSSSPVTKFSIITIVVFILDWFLRPASDPELTLFSALLALAGIAVMVYLLALISSMLSWSIKDRAASLFLLVYFVMVVPAMTEYYFFSPVLIGVIYRHLAPGFISAAVIVGLVARLFVPEGSTSTLKHDCLALLTQRSIFSWP